MDYNDPEKMKTNASIVNGINISDNWVELAYFQPDASLYITDISLNANKDGTFRIKYDGNIMKVLFYKAKTPIFINRTLPFPILDGKKFSVEFKTEVDDTNTSVCIAGYEL